MTDGNGQAQDAGTQQQAQSMSLKVLAQYIRDMSFENMLVQRGIQGEVAPEVSVQVNLDARKRQADNQYEVVVKFRVESKNKGKDEVLFLLELEYGGVFLVENLAEEHLHPVLMIECPRLLFPFIRRIVSDVTRDGGFPPVNIDTVDFVALYRSELARRAATQQAEATRVTQ